ncbi:peroxisome assembly protein 26 isoform X2 [Sceloporus undulatus]|uniref:peroxisome assembly protein 26 isoform X2 n=1 Tax=Sceloporus undulatus TaxID=8520 RepID=UPI001C4C28FB|nr:peroxisome assembly protein 26 isoform X2 [Sceloporus undulatus]
MMRSDFSAALAAIGGPGGLLRSSEPLSLSPVASLAASFLEDATDLLVMHRDFPAALEKCEKGCQSLMGESQNGDPNSSEELKCSLCIVGIQALAEMDRWRDVLPWILQFYQDPDCWPPKILELCILLHSKVEEPQVMLEIGSDWLHSSMNQHLPSYGLLVQLYLFHVLLPLGHFAEAEVLVQGCKALSEEQHIEMHESIEEKRHQWLRQEEECLIPEAPPDVAWKQQFGWVSQKMLTVLAQLSRVLGSLAASPTALPFIYRLLQLFHQARLAVFSSHFRPPIQD